MTSKVVIPKAGRLVANLVWTDAAGSPNAAKALVNDLDLKIVLTDGRTLNTNDQINNHAFAQADVSSGLEATVTVSGINIPMGVNGKQPYALILSIQ